MSKGDVVSSSNFQHSDLINSSWIKNRLSLIYWTIQFSFSLWSCNGAKLFSFLQSEYNSRLGDYKLRRIPDQTWSTMISFIYVFMCVYLCVFMCVVCMYVFYCTVDEDIIFCRIFQFLKKWQAKIFLLLIQGWL